jgi:hypothetical protein
MRKIYSLQHLRHALRIWGPLCDEGPRLEGHLEAMIANALSDP